MTEIVVGIADMKIGQGEQLIKTSLGSCIAVCIYSREIRAGGMIHFMLPKMDETTVTKVDKGNIKIAKYGHPGILELIHQLQTKFKLKNNDLTAKIFGGAKMLKNVSSEIGLHNEKIAREILHNEKIKILATKTGGEKGYKIDFDLNSGIVYCQVFGDKVEQF
ncbi:MAG: chemotaxis protein CheD [Oligoflexia bacterium]|nr:chemotaxis protein CheD [Oligoflexia bacterium]